MKAQAEPGKDTTKKLSVGGHRLLSSTCDNKESISKPHTHTQKKNPQKTFSPKFSKDISCVQMCPYRQTQTHTQITPLRAQTRTQAPGAHSRTGGSCKPSAETKQAACAAAAAPVPFQHCKESGGEKKSGGAGRKRPPPRPARPARRGADAGPRTYSEDPMARPPLPAAPKPPPPAAARPGSSGRPRAPRAGGAAPRPAGPRPRPPRSDVRRLGAGYLWQGYSECSLGRVLIAVPWDL